MGRFTTAFFASCQPFPTVLMNQSWESMTRSGYTPWQEVGGLRTMVGKYMKIGDTAAWMVLPEIQ